MVQPSTTSALLPSSNLNVAPVVSEEGEWTIVERSGKDKGKAPMVYDDSANNLVFGDVVYGDNNGFAALRGELAPDEPPDILIC